MRKTTKTILIMNEVSIIINGVRYDAVIGNRFHFCEDCELRDICDDGDYHNQTICEKFRVAWASIFKKSAKSFER